MNDSNTTNSLFNVELPPSVDNVIKNLTDEPSHTIGSILSDLLELTFGPISTWAEKARFKRTYELEQFREKLLESANKIPAEKLIEPSMQIVAQALEDSKYCLSEKELQEMFVSLISSSMNTDFARYVHPSFSGIIKQMSTLDAKIIALFKDDRLPVLPVCQYCVTIPGAASASAIPEHIFLEIPEDAVSPNSVSLISLSRFGLIMISYSEWLHDETQYKKFSTHPFYTDLQRSFPLGSYSIKKGIVRLTSLGRSFVDMCVPD